MLTPSSFVPRCACLAEAFRVCCFLIASLRACGGHMICTILQLRLRALHFAASTCGPCFPGLPFCRPLPPGSSVALHGSNDVSNDTHTHTQTKRQTSTTLCKVLQLSSSPFLGWQCECPKHDAGIAADKVTNHTNTTLSRGSAPPKASLACHCATAYLLGCVWSTVSYLVAQHEKRQYHFLCASTLVTW